MKTLFQQTARTAARTLDFRGRSRRAEVAGYLVLSQLPVAIAGLGTSWLEDPALARAIVLAVLVLVTLPVFALTIRRFHDFDRSGWWSAPFLALVCRTLILEAIGLGAGWNVRAAIESVISYVDWLLILPAVASFAVMLAWPSRKDPAPPESKTTGTEGSVPVA